MTIRVCLTNLGKYNEGELVCEWLDLPATEDETQEVLDAIGIDEEYEEYFISDYETEIDGLKIGEYENLEHLNELAERIEALDDYEQKALEAVMENECDIERALDIVEGGDFTFYADMDLTEVAESMVDDGLFGDTQAMGTLVNYIDYEALGRDLGFDGYNETRHGVIYYR